MDPLITNQIVVYYQLEIQSFCLYLYLCVYLYYVGNCKMNLTIFLNFISTKLKYLVSSLSLSSLVSSSESGSSLSFTLVLRLLRRSLTETSLKRANLTISSATLASLIVTRLPRRAFV